MQEAQEAEEEGDHGGDERLDRQRPPLAPEPGRHSHRRTSACRASQAWAAALSVSRSAGGSPFGSKR